MRRWATTTVMFAIFTVVNGGQPWKLQLHCPEEKIDLHLDLYEESIEVPGMETFGPMNMSLSGNFSCRVLARVESTV